jgi:hypothetical protein
MFTTVARAEPIPIPTKMRPSFEIEKWRVSIKITGIASNTVR